MLEIKKQQIEEEGSKSKFEPQIWIGFLIDKTF